MNKSTVETQSEAQLHFKAGQFAAELSQSPDTNKNDLGFYWSLDSKLPQFRSFDLDDFAKEVQDAFDSYMYDTTILTRIDRAKKIILQRIIKAGGDNVYDTIILSRKDESHSNKH